MLETTVRFVCITAGSGFATSELRVLVLDVIDSTYILWPSIVLAVFVGDLTIEACGQSAASMVAQATDHIITFFEKGLRMVISSTKSLTVGSKLSVANRVHAHMYSKKAKPARQAKLLGTSSGGGRKRSVVHLFKRIGKVRSKVQRLHALRKLGLKTALMARAAATPAVT